MTTVLWSPLAEQDLENIFLYVAREQRSAAVAGRIIRLITEQAELYANQALLGTPRPEFGDSIRVYHAHRYVILYRPSAHGIEVVRVIHGSRDVLKVFRHEES